MSNGRQSKGLKQNVYHRFCQHFQDYSSLIMKTFYKASHFLQLVFWYLGICSRVWVMVWVSIWFRVCVKIWVWAWFDVYAWHWCVAPYAYQGMDCYAWCIFAYAISTARREVCKCVYYIQMLFVHNVGEPLYPNYNYCSTIFVLLRKYTRWTYGIGCIQCNILIISIVYNCVNTAKHSM